MLAVREPGVLDEIHALVPLDDHVYAGISDARRLVDRARLAKLNDLLADASTAPFTRCVRGERSRWCSPIEVPEGFELGLHLFIEAMDPNPFFGGKGNDRQV